MKLQKKIFRCAVLLFALFIPLLFFISRHLDAYLEVYEHRLEEAPSWTSKTDIGFYFPSLKQSKVGFLQRRFEEMQFKILYRASDDLFYPSGLSSNEELPVTHADGAKSFGPCKFLVGKSAGGKSWKVQVTQPSHLFLQIGPLDIKLKDRIDVWTSDPLEPVELPKD